MKLKHNTVFLIASRVTVDSSQIWHYTLSCASLFSHNGTTGSRRAWMDGQPSLYNPAQKQRSISAPSSSQARGSCRLAGESWLQDSPSLSPSSHLSAPSGKKHVLQKVLQNKHRFKTNLFQATISPPINMLHVKHLSGNKCLQKSPEYTQKLKTGLSAL